MMAHQRYLTWRQYFALRNNRDRYLYVALQVDAHTEPSFSWLPFSWERQDSWSFRSNPVLVAHPTTNDEGEFLCQICIKHSFRNFQPIGGWTTPSQPNISWIRGKGETNSNSSYPNRRPATSMVVFCAHVGSHAPLDYGGLLDTVYAQL